MKIDPVQYKNTLADYKMNSKRYVRVSCKTNQDIIDTFIKDTNATKTFIKGVYELDGS